MALHAERDPGGVAVLHEDCVRTRGELERRTSRLARAYAALGVKEGSLVTIALPNGIEFLEACLATWKLGATPQPVSSRLPGAERDAIVELADPALVVGVEATPIREAEGRAARRGRAESAGRPSLAAGFEPDPALPAAPLPDALPRCARAMTSGGSTGRPKLILDTAVAECDPGQVENGMRAGGTTLVAGPLYHAGPFLTAWSQLLCGGRVVLMTRFDARPALELIERHRVDWVLFVPTMMQRIWRLPEEERTRYDLSSLRRVMCTGAPSPAWLKRAWIDWLGAERIWEAYGGTERTAGTLISGTEWLSHPGSVGRPTHGRRIRILDAEGRECPPGTVGEVFMMPPGGQGSTYRYVGAEAAATDDGWESLGDLGWLDEDGYLYLADRKTDMILSGGANVYPAEVEAALDAHPAVRSSAVIGLPDDDLGQRVHALVDALRPVGEQELREHLANHLVRYKIPRSFEFVAEPLRDDAGKVRRSALREARLSRPRPGEPRRPDEPRPGEPRRPEDRS
jgi:bile acid-coenzyme A ligase